MRKLKYFFDLCKLLLAVSLSPFYINKHIWIIGERKGEAKDNGYHLFKYIRENHPKENVFYVIDKKSNDLGKISHLGNVVYYDSLKHYLYYFSAQKLVCAHVGSCVPDSPICWKAEEQGKIKKSKIFIQHGITKEKINSLMFNNTKARMFVCGGKPEYDFVKSNFGYKDDGVKYLGFCRFDNLHNFKVKKQILIMPTWRQWFGMSNNNDENGSEVNFLSSNYYNKFQSLLNNESLHKLLDENNMDVIFYPHFEMQRFIDHFSKNNRRIIIADKEKYDVQELLKESEILITDYSSVAFDFAYMRKKMIYYQFDSDEYYKSHYSKGYFDYRQHGFGPLVKNEEDLIFELVNMIKGENHQNYNERCKEFFPLYDSENCKRHYWEIKKI